MTSYNVVKVKNFKIKKHFRFEPLEATAIYKKYQYAHRLKKSQIQVKI